MWQFVAVFGLVGLYVLQRYLTRASIHLPLPPGPPGLPIVGNVRDLPASDSPDWLHWLKHKDLYGPISTVSALGQRLIILNDVQLAIELLNKKSAVHSDRPDMPFALLAGWGDGSAILRYSKRVHAYRKKMYQEIGTKAGVARFQQTQDIEVGRFLLRMLDAPERLTKHARKLAGAVVLKITYGYSIDQEADDPLVDIADEALVNFSISARPGTWLVDSAPFLKYVPAWFPGAGFRRTAKIFRKQTAALADVPYAFVKRQMQQSEFEPSYVSNLLQESPVVPGSQEETTIRWSAASLYGGGADTTVSTISSFFLAITIFPDVQKRAQEEIDSKIGRSRLPTIDDRDDLPYVDALVKEALRWHPVLPMGLPHRSMADDICNGYLVPKDSVILPNIWAFCHDPSEYKDPMTFNPERFLGATPERDPHSLVFGFGRRICPGRVLADRTVFLAISQSLAAFTIGSNRESEEDGKVVGAHPIFLPGVISHPAPFELSLKLRDPGYEGMIRSVEREHPWQRTHAEILRGMPKE
ncbi:putative cytochrome P450 oxidoreductase OrdA-like protein [Aspergillus karnatakaensis]|uniref:cytochrome P450 n=1 Tax=Aspergillus karnatakaensis TaxID=1810916 RepID=UPI003CCE4D49